MTRSSRTKESAAISGFSFAEKEMASTTESGRDVPASGQSGAKAPAVYQGFDGQYVDGSLRPGKHGGGYRQPLGVIGVISPWNFPMYLPHRSIGPALALGNAVVVKPAEDTPVTGGLLLAKIYEEAGLPPGLLNVVIGPISEIGDPFTLPPIPRLISFTGSKPGGRQIRASP